MTELKLSDYLRRPRESKREKELLRRLREAPEDERFQFVYELLQRDAVMGLLMATGSLRQPRHFEAILEMGFQKGDASSICSWLACAVPKLGFHKVIRLLDDKMETDPIIVDKALYWMPKFKPQNDPEADLAMYNLRLRLDGLTLEGKGSGAEETLAELVARARGEISRGEVYPLESIL